MAFHRPVTRSAPWVLVVGCALFAWSSCSSSTEPDTRSTEGPDAESVVADPCVNLLQPVSLEPILPTTFGPDQQQQGADCIAWQEFIYLNWRSDPAHPGQPDKTARSSAFGAPNDDQLSVWESYLEASQVFGSSGQEQVTDWMVERPAAKQLGRVSKVNDTAIELSAIAQAGDNKWLTDQRGNLVFYEVKVNEDEYDYITSNHLTTRAGQLACVTGKAGLQLPQGSGADVDCGGVATTYGDDVGAIELKAAWIQLPADGSLNYRYRTAAAQLHMPDGDVVSATVGLVGLHIIHKMVNAQQFVWATFEQIDNTPDDAVGNPAPPVLPANPNRKPSPGYNFFNPECDPSTDVYMCKKNLLPGDPCAPTVAPDTDCDPYTAPMQITRIQSVTTTEDNVNAYVWGLLPADSVFNYYRLINVQWPSSPADVAPGSFAPIDQGDITPSTAVANVTMETFQQDTNTCMSCHRSASIAAAPRCESKCYASDYSFVFLTETQS